MSAKVKPRIALVVSHPIQHFCPQYASFAEHPDIEFKVFFASSLGLDKYIDPNFKMEISWKNMPIDSFEHEFVNGRTPLPSGADLDAPQIEQSLEAFKPDIVIIYGYFQKLSRRVHRWASCHNVKIGYISDSELRQKTRSWIKPIKKIWLRYYFSKIDYFLTVGDANEEYYRSLGAKQHQLVRMHFPIDQKLYDASYLNRQVLRAQVRQKHGIAEDAIVTCVVGKLVTWKNQDHLVDALRLLEIKNRKLELLLVGSGELEDVILEKSNSLKINRVHHVGFVNTDVLPGYYAAADMYSHPASREPHSIAISEAIAMGNPIICSDTCGSHGPSDDVQTTNGLIYPFGNIHSLTDCFSTLMGSTKMRQEFGLKSRHLSESFQHCAHKNIIDSLISKL